AETRAQRRFAELKRSDKTVQYATVLKAVLERDARDKTRASAPLQAASDAHHLDTSDLTIQQACSDAITYIAKIQRGEA
ncbi:MAG: cytidylate kinase, partial [Rhodobacteraceae bacterium]|nr:cytidylate kinase [Paracoccaceae bacterium]